jgi:hypothetical protein
LSNLTIVDLDFCESELLGKTEKTVKGGITVYSPTGSAWSSSNASGYADNYSKGYSVDKNTGSISYYVAAQTGGAVAGAVAGATADGSTYVGTSSSAFVS